MTTYALIACSKEKRQPVNKMHAGAMYLGDLHRKAQRLAKMQNQHRLILSAKYGVLHLADMIEPYDQTMYDLTAAHRRCWAKQVASQLAAIGIGPGDRLVIYAGNTYCGFLELLPEGIEIERPLSGLGIGEQKSKLKRMIQAEIRKQALHLEAQELAQPDRRMDSQYQFSVMQPARQNCGDPCSIPLEHTGATVAVMHRIEPDTRDERRWAERYALRVLDERGLDPRDYCVNVWRDGKYISQHGLR